MSRFLHKQHVQTCRAAPTCVTPHQRASWGSNETFQLLEKAPRSLAPFKNHCRFQGAALAKSLEKKLIVTTAAAATETAAPGDHVKVHYTGSLEDGTEFDSSRAREPLEFVVGGGTVISGFDQAVTGLKVGDKRKHAVKPEDGYGEWREEMLAKIPTKDLNFGDEVDVGTRLRLANGLEAVVREKNGESITIDANPPLAGKTLRFDVELVQLTKGASLDMATFGAGCFWGPELMFARVPGVVSTEVGYSQGTIENPTYEDVCTGLTGHNEVVQVAYDPRQVSYEELLQVFIKGHNPTQADGQGGDLGTQYRSGIYFHTSEQKRAAEDFLKKAQADYKAPIATEVEAVTNFCEAEDYHQQYLVRGGRFGRPQSANKGCTDPIRCYG